MRIHTVLYLHNLNVYILYTSTRNIICGEIIQTAFRTMQNLDDMHCLDLYRFVMICSFGRAVVPNKIVVLLLQTKRHLLMLMKRSSKHGEVYRVLTVTRCGTHTHTIDQTNICLE